MKPPIIIIGAGRSGTKLLRAIFGAHPQLAIFPREINYVWRHGNAAFPTDEFQLCHAREDVIRYIRGHFERWSKQQGGRQLVEKTCANTLRVGFVHAVFPEAYIIHLIRDGRAVAESARRRWLAGPDFKYLIEKLHWVPLTDVPYYGLRYFHDQIGRLSSGAGAPKSWGPRFSGLDELVAKNELIEVCGVQWKVCVEAAHRAMQHLPVEQAITIRYEELVAEPEKVIHDVLSRLDLRYEPACKEYIQRAIDPRHVAKWQASLSQRDLDVLIPRISNTLVKFGYED